MKLERTYAHYYDAYVIRPYAGPTFDVISYGDGEVGLYSGHHGDKSVDVLLGPDDVDRLYHALKRERKARKYR